MNSAAQSSQTPALSVILATAGKFANIRPTFRHLQRQTVASQLEVIVLAPVTSDFGLPPNETSAFGNFQLVELGRTLPVAEANAEGVRRAAAPVVVFAEDHAFPAKDWAAALLARHAEDWAAVGPVVKNANPAGAVSWADYLVGYGPWHSAQPSGPVPMLPGHNSSYKRAALLQFGEKLADELTAESVLQQSLLDRGERLFLESRAVIAHLNFAQWRIFLPVQYQNGRQYAACRRRPWPAWKRAFYALASPLIPVVRFVRILRFRTPLPARPGRLQIFAALAVGLLSNGIGQAFGYLAGPGKSTAFLTEYEYDRARFAGAHEVRD